ASERRAPRCAGSLRADVTPVERTHAARQGRLPSGSEPPPRGSVSSCQPQLVREALPPAAGTAWTPTSSEGVQELPWDPSCSPSRDAYIICQLSAEAGSE